MRWLLLLVPFLVVISAAIVVSLRASPYWFYGTAGVIVAAMFGSAFTFLVLSRRKR